MNLECMDEERRAAGGGLQAEEASAMARRMVQVYADFATDIAAMPVVVGATLCYATIVVFGVAMGNSCVLGCYILTVSLYMPLKGPMSSSASCGGYRKYKSHCKVIFVGPVYACVAGFSAELICRTLSVDATSVTHKCGFVLLGRKSRLESFAGANTTFTIEAMMGDRRALQVCPMFGGTTKPHFAPVGMQ